MAVTSMRPNFAMFREPVDHAIFELSFGLWQHLSQASHRLWIAVVTLPDRGCDAMPDDVPDEFFRFPPF